MKLAQFYVPDQDIRIGVLQDKRFVDRIELAPDIRTVDDRLARSDKKDASTEKINE